MHLGCLATSWQGCCSPAASGGILDLRVQGWVEPLVEFALGIIAYLIGGAMTTAQLRRSGRTILGTAAGESLGAVGAMFLVMLWITRRGAGPGLRGFGRDYRSGGLGVSVGKLLGLSGFTPTRMEKDPI